MKRIHLLLAIQSVVAILVSINRLERISDQLMA